MSTLLTQVEQLIRSSRFRSGAYSVPLEEGVSIPGRQDPAELLDICGIKDMTDKVGAVALADNGGVLAELLLRGASRVAGFEHRVWCHSGLTELVKIHPGRQKMLIFNDLPEKKEELVREHFEPCDIVVIPEGWQNETRHPLRFLRSCLRLLKAGGSIFIEVNLGRQGAPEEPTNAWYPSQNSFLNAIRNMLSYSPELDMRPGKLEGRTIYRFERPGVKMTPKSSNNGKVVTTKPKDVDNKVKKAQSKPPNKPKAKDPKRVAAGKQAAKTRAKNKAAAKKAAKT